MTGCIARGNRSCVYACGISIAVAAITLAAFGIEVSAGQDQTSNENQSAASSLELLQATQVAFRSVAATMRPYLVQIETVGGTQPRNHRLDAGDDEGDDSKKPRRSQRPFRETLGGAFNIADGPTTGIIYSADGYIVTGGFNFIREPLLISVRFADGKRVAADLVARDQVRKIALLKVDPEELAAGHELPVPRWSEEVDIRVGQWAVALGLGAGGDDPSLNVGIVSALNRMAGFAVQTDAKLSPVNYGGPLCDLHGRIIGLSVPMAQRPGELAGVEMYDSGVAFAVPLKRLDPIIKHLKTGQSFYRGWLGISVGRGGSDSVVISNVAIPSPMNDAGVEPGDRIIYANGKRTHHFGGLIKAIYLVPAGKRVLMVLSRDGDEFEVTVTLARSSELGELPDLAEPFDPAAPTKGPEEE